MKGLRPGDTFHLATIEWRVVRAHGASLYVTKADSKGTKIYLVTADSPDEFRVHELIAGLCRVGEEVARGPIIKLRQKSAV